MRILRLSHFALSTLLLAGCPETPPPVPEIPPAETSLARAMKLEDERSDGGGELELLLGDLDDRVRARAALALGRLGDPSAALKLTPLLTDPSPYVRATAAFSLGILEGPLPEDAAASLTDALDDEEPRVRGRVAEALARVAGENAAEALGAELARWVPRGAEPYEWNEALTLSSVTLPHPDVRAGLLALGRLRSSGPAWEAIATEGATPRFLWWPAAWTASQLPGDQLEPLLLYYAGSPDPVLRLYGARGLSGLSPEKARPHLRALLFDPSETVRIEAIRAAARLEALELVPDLLGHLDADSRYVQTEVLRALVALPSEATIEPLVDRIGDPSPWIRGLALEALARQDPESFWLLLSGIGADPAWEVRRRMAELFAGMKGDRPRELLVEMLEDEDGRVRGAALRSLRVVAPETAASVSIRHLAGPDPFERVAAAETLAAAGSKEAFAPLEQAFLAEKDRRPAHSRVAPEGPLDPRSREGAAYRHRRARGPEPLPEEGRRVDPGASGRRGERSSAVERARSRRLPGEPRGAFLTAGIHHDFPRKD